MFSLNQHNRIRGHGFLPADRADKFAGLGLHIDGFDRQADQFGQSQSNRRLEWGKFRTLRKNRTVEIDEAPSGGPNPVERRPEQNCRIDPRIGRVGIRKGVSDISQSGRAQECIGEGMQHNISVAVPCQTPVKFDLYTAQNQRTIRDQPVSIVP